MELIVQIIIACIPVVGVIITNFYSTRRTTSIIKYQIEQLEQKVNKHNQIIERVYALEEDVEWIKMSKN